MIGSTGGTMKNNIYFGMNIRDSRSRKQVGGDRLLKKSIEVKPFSDEEVSRLLSEAQEKDYADPNKYDQHTCGCGAPIERIGFSYYYLHVKQGRFFSKVMRESKETQCSDPKPKRKVRT